MLIDAPPLGCSLESIFCCGRRFKQPELPIQMPQSEGPPDESYHYDEQARALPSFGMPERNSANFPSFCDPYHFPEEVIHLYQNTNSELSSSITGWSSISASFSSGIIQPSEHDRKLNQKDAKDESGIIGKNLQEGITNERGRKGKWRKYEDETMMAIVQYTSQGDSEVLHHQSFWDQVSTKLSEALNTHRNAASCKKRYHKMRIRANLLSKAESKMIAELSLQKKNESLSSSLVPLETTDLQQEEPPIAFVPRESTGRTAGGDFTKEEDEQLVQFYLNTNKNWRKIQAKMPHRTVTQLKSRFYKKLKSHFEEERRRHHDESIQRVYSLRNRKTTEKQKEEIKKTEEGPRQKVTYFSSSLANGERASLNVEGSIMTEPLSLSWIAISSKTQWNYLYLPARPSSSTFSMVVPSICGYVSKVIWQSLTKHQTNSFL